MVLISGHGNIESAVRAIKMGAFDFVEKPLSLEKTVLSVVRQRAGRQRTGSRRGENRALRAPRRSSRRRWSARARLMRHLREQIAMAAPTNGRVLISGENGTGKELGRGAHHPHAELGAARTSAFVEVNHSRCGHSRRS